jgi:hypothetical protein
MDVYDYESLIPKNFDTYDLETQQNIIAYIKQLTPIERKAYIIAVEHLGSSFHLLKSNGYNDWLKNNK